jgi:DNA-binding MurR/RpiR family transcriptional regulator
MKERTSVKTRIKIPEQTKPGAGRNGHSLEALIRSKIDSCSKRERIVAEYFLEQLNDIAFLSIHDISEKLNVGPSSVVRFAKKLGYAGFLELKNDIKTHIKLSIAPLEQFRLSIEGTSLPVTSIQQIAEFEVNNINHLVNNFSEESLQKAISILSRAPIIYTAGFNLSSFLAGITSYLLHRVGMKSFPANLGGRSLDEQLVTMNGDDALIAFSLPPYSSQTIRAAQFAKRLGCKVISITNSPASPIVKHSDVVFRVKSESGIFTNSVSSILLVLYVLVNELAILNKGRFKETAKKIQLLKD